jgi:hypothetical protein
VALQRSTHILVFQDDGVHRLPFTAEPSDFPNGTWALTDTNDEVAQPCTAFLGAAQQDIAWIVHATSPAEGKYKAWQHQKAADMFVMNYFSMDEITVLRFVSLI